CSPHGVGRSWMSTGRHARRSPARQARGRLRPPVRVRHVVAVPDAVLRRRAPAALCELVGAVTAYVMTGEKPGLRAKVPPVEFLATPARPACTRPRPRAPLHRGARTARS